MAEKLKITPRARRVAKENGLSMASLQIGGTGYGGGICEQDIIVFLKSGRIKATPLAKKIAESKGLLLEEIRGSGSNGKVKKADVLSMLEKEQAFRQEDNPLAGEMAEESIFVEGKEVLQVIPYTGIRKIIGERLSRSKFTAPHLYFTQKVNLKRLFGLRKEINAGQAKKTSVTDYIAKAVIITLQKYPGLNASLLEEKIVQYRNINLGIAVAAPSGLIVPVLKAAERKTLLEISKESALLFEKARTGKLTPGEYSGGTFTISNLGMFGIENFTAIINPPEAGILAVSATKEEPYVETDDQGEKTISIKPMMNITLSVDHRIIDGLLAAQFVTEVKRLLENPIELML